MIKIENNRVFSDEGKTLLCKKTGAYVGNCFVLPEWTADDFEEVDDEPAYSENDYKCKVRELIARRYSIEDELALQRQKETKPEQYAEYDAYCESCKAEARAMLTGAD